MKLTEKLTEKLAQDLLLIAQAGDDGWKLWEHAYPGEPHWEPAAWGDSVLEFASDIAIRIKEKPDEHWRALPDECPKAGDYWKPPAGKWTRLENDDVAGWAWIVEGSEFRTLRPKP